MRSMIGLALLGGVILFFVSIGLRSPQHGSGHSVLMRSGTVLVAKEDIIPGESLSPENVTLKQWPLARIPEGAATQLTELQGKVPSTHFYSGEAIPLSKLCSIDCLVPNPGGKLPTRFLVASVLVRDDAESRRVVTGDRVDVLAIQANDRDERATDARTVLRNVTVFAALPSEPDDSLGTVRRSISLRFDPTQIGQMELVKFAAGADGPLLVRQVGSSASDEIVVGETAPVSVDAPP